MSLRYNLGAFSSPIKRQTAAPRVHLSIQSFTNSGKMAVVLFSRTRVISYRADACSSGTFILLLCLTIAWLAPVFVVYGSGKVWDRTGLLNPDQPKIKFRYEMIMKAVTHDDGSFLTFSTFSDYNKLFKDFLRVPTIKVSEEDEEGDQVNDWMDFEVSLPLAPGERVHQMELLLSFDYVLQSQMFRMESLGYVDVIPEIHGSRVELLGDLILIQSGPLPHYARNELLDVSAINASSSYEMFDILDEYHKRRVRTELRVASISTRMSDNSSFLLKGTVNYRPQSDVVNAKSQFVMFKWAYIQYVYVALPFITIMGLVLDHTFTYRLVPAISSPGLD